MGQITYISHSSKQNMSQCPVKEFSTKNGKIFVEEIDPKSLVNLIVNPEVYLKSRGLEISRETTRGTFSVTIKTETNSRSKDLQIPSDQNVVCESFIFPVYKILADNYYSSVVGYKVLVSCK